MTLRIPFIGIHRKTITQGMLVESKTVTQGMLVESSAGGLQMAMLIWCKNNEYYKLKQLNY